MEPVVLCGVQAVEFKDRTDGHLVKGTNVYWKVKIPDRYGKGERCEKVFISAERMPDEERAKLAPGTKLLIYWNQYGSVAGVEIK